MILFVGMEAQFARIRKRIRPALVNMSPPNTTQSIQQEGRIALALEAFKQGCFTSIRAAARSYGVPITTLHRRVHNHPAPRD